VPGTQLDTYRKLVQVLMDPPIDLSAIEPSIEPSDSANIEKIARRLVACWNACEGISTDDIESVSKNTGPLLANKLAEVDALRIMATQRDELLAALQSIADYAKRDGDIIAQHLGGIAKAAIFAAQPTTGPTIAELQEAGHLPAAEPSAEHFTSITKGGTYEKLGAIRGAGQLKGLAGIAYRDVATGGLFIRTPECFAARMKKVEQGEGGAA